MLGAVAEFFSDAVDALLNVGADLPPEVRETAQKVVVSAIIVTQVATQAATMAASSAAAAASTSSSSASRRKE